jgi:PAS domain S-box-containing protein
MILKRTAKIYALLLLAVGCSRLFGQPTASAPAPVPATNQTVAPGLDRMPLRTIASLVREWSTARLNTNEWVHLRGTVLDQRPGEYLVIRDETGTMLATSSQTLGLKMETVVDVWGTAAGDLNRYYLRNATFRMASAPGTGDTNAIALQKPATLPVLTKVRQVRELSATEAGWEYPVKLRAVVTLAFQHTRTYVEDDTAGIFIRSRVFRGNFKPGDLVEIEGTSNPGWYAPVVVPTKITVLGTAPLPNPPEVSLFQMANGQYDSQWVKAEGVVRGLRLAQGVVQIKLSDRDGTFLVNLPADTTPSNLLDSVVTIRGVCASLFNNKRQITGVEMWTPSLDAIQIEQPAVADPFSLPLQSIVSLSQSPRRAGLQRRAKVVGIVTAVEPGKFFFVQDADDGIQVFSTEKNGIKAGDRVEVAGYPAPGDYGSVLRDAVVRVTGKGALPAAKKVDQDSPLDPQLNNQWVEAEAEVTGDAEMDREPVVPLQMGDTIFKARILNPGAEKSLPTRTSRVRVAGVYQVLTDELRAPRSFQIIAPSGQDVQIIQSPSPWNLEHTLVTVGMLALVAGLALLWVLLLRRKVAEQTAILQQSELKFRSLVEQSLVGVYVYQDGHFVYANPRMAEIYGYSIEELTTPSLTLRQTIAADDWPIVESEFVRRMKGEVTTAHFTLRGVRKDGFLVNLEVTGAQGQFNGRPAIRGTAVDITERKIAENKLAEASNLLATLMENSPDCIYFKDRDSRFVHYSKAFEKLFKLSEGQKLRGKSDFDFFLVEHARAAFEDEQEIIRSGQPLIGKFEVEPHADGRVTHALTTKVPWRDSTGNIVGTFGISKDVTSLKETEAKLAYERDLFHALLENFPDSIYFKDLESRFVRVSRSKVISAMKTVRSQFESKNPGVAPDQLPLHLQNSEEFGKWLIGKTDFDTFNEARARSAYEDERAIVRTGEPMVAKIEQNPQADGQTAWCITTKLPWRDKDGKIIGTFGVSKDITALKQAEKDLESAHQRLLETSRLAGMAEVATDVLHNVGNVLNSVNVSCSLTIDRVKGSKISSLAKTAALLAENRGRLGDFFTIDPRGQQIPTYLAALSDHFVHEQSALLQELEQLLKHIEHIKQIVAMQQSYAKVAGVIETINPTQLVDDAVHINGAALTRHDVQVRCEFEKVPMIQTEKHRVLQILVNLIRNAKYALDDAKRPDKLLTIKLGRNGGDHIKIEVTDNGVGIPKENLTRIFAHGFTTRNNGHGFGLHSSAIAIQELGGSLTAHSEGEGKGATFTLLLPEKPITAQEAISQ